MRRKRSDYNEDGTLTEKAKKKEEKRLKELEEKKNEEKTNKKDKIRNQVKPKIQKRKREDDFNNDKNKKQKNNLPEVFIIII